MKYNNWKVATCLILISIFFSYLMVYFFIDWDDFNNLKVIEYSDKKLVSDKIGRATRLNSSHRT